MLVLTEIIPIIVLIGIIIALLAIALILRIHSEKSAITKAKEADFFDRAIAKKKKSISAQISGVTWNEYAALLFIAPLSCGILGYILLPIKSLCIVTALIGVFIPDLLVKLLNRKRKLSFEEKYARALKQMASSLRCGLSMEQAIEDVGNSVFIDERIRTGFRQISSDIKVGVPIAEAFASFAENTKSEDAEDVAAAIAMQAQVGGSEAQIISTIAQNINDQIMIRREIRALFAETSIMVTAMDIIPYAVILLMYYATPEFISPYFENFGMTLVLIGILAFTTVGSFVIRRMAKKVKGG